MAGRHFGGGGFNCFGLLGRRLGPAGVGSTGTLVSGPASGSTSAFATWVCHCSTRSRMPLTNRLDWAVLYRLASSSASLMATLAGTSRAEEHLVGPEPQDVAVDGGHPVEPPVLGDLGDHRVDPGLMLLDARRSGPR